MESEEAGSTSKAALFAELSAEQVNVLRVRALCRSHPGLIASSGVRMRVWSLLLLGSQSFVQCSSSTSLSSTFANSNSASGEKSCASTISEESRAASKNKSIFSVLSGGDFEGDCGGGGGYKGGVGLLAPDADKPCGEMHVLEADVRRTRSDMECFRATSWRLALTQLLHSFCYTHAVQYKQGMNEVAAPFLYLLPASAAPSAAAPPTHTLALSYVLFEAFVFRFLAHFYCQESSSSMYLFKAFRLFQLLLLHFDPQLGLHLCEHEFIPELYAPQWFLCVYARGLPLSLVLRLWDMLITVDDPSFTFFIGLAMLTSRRDELLRADAANMPEVIGSMRLEESESGVDTLLREAWRLHQQAPRCFLRYLRICCVATPELAPCPPSKVFVVKDHVLCPALTTSASPSHSFARSRSSGSGSGVATHFNRVYTLDASVNAAGSVCGAGSDWEAYYVGMARQSVRRCVMLQASELVAVLCPPSDPQPHNKTYTLPPSPSDTNIDPDTDDSTNKSTANSSGGHLEQKEHEGPSSPSFQQRHFVLIDIRSSEEILASGGGDMPTSLRVDPSFLLPLQRHRPAVGGGEAKGAGERMQEEREGEGMLDKWLDHFDSLRGLHVVIVDFGGAARASGAALWRRLLLGQGDGMAPTLVSYDSSTSAASSLHSGGNGGPCCERDLTSVYPEEEEAAAIEDQGRAAVQLATILQEHGFPFVSVLDGGFPALVHHLSSGGGSRRSLENSTLVINHDADKYRTFLAASGRREVEGMKEEEVGVRWQPRADLMLVRGSASGSRRQRVGGEEKGGSIGESEVSGGDRTDDTLRVALTVARRLQHTRMSQRIAALIAAADKERSEVGSSGVE